MDINLKNSFLNERYNISTKGQCLFIQRWIEMFNKKTIDTYKPRLTNTHSILEEYVDVLKKIHTSVLMESHKDHIHNEANKKIQKDLILRKKDITLFNTIMSRLNRKKVTITKQIDDFEIILKQLDSNYLGWILEDLKKNIDNNNLDQILDNVESLATELVSNGWSKNSLYRLVKKVFYEQKEFEIKWDEFVHYIISDKVEFKCYIKVEASEFYRDIILGSQLKDELILDVKNNTNLDSVIKEQLIWNIDQKLNISLHEPYFIFKGEAYSQDLSSFAEYILEELSKIQSEYTYFDKNIRFKLARSIVVLPTNTITTYNIIDMKESFKDSGLRPAISMDKYKQIQANIENTDIEKRLSNILNQYRLGSNSDNVENWFSSFWFALESLVSTQQYETIIDNIINIVCPIATLKYPKVIIESLAEDLNKSNINLVEILANIDTTQNNIVNDNELISCQEVAASIDLGTENIYEDIMNLVKILKDERLKEILKNEISDYSLLNMRVESVSKLFQNSSTFKNFLENHYQNLTLHLRRLYRIRNSFVHSANIEYDLYPITMHLHSYLMDVLDEIFNALEKGCTNQKIEQIYSCSDLKYRMLIDKLENQKERDFDIKIICFENYCQNI